MTTPPAASGAAPPVFVGGVGRSGTHILAHLIGSHSRYEMVPREVRFHSLRKGLIGFVEGTLAREELVERLRSFWWKRPNRWNPGASQGLHTFVPEEDFEVALAAFTATDDRLEAGRTLLRSMLDPIARRAGKDGWVEHSPNNVVMAHGLLSILPEARVVHVVRDGRDRACSMLSLPWGANTVREAIEIWERRLRRSEQVAREIPADRLLVLHLEDVTLLDRENSYGRLLHFLELEDEPAVRSFFEAEVTAERAHVGRWQEELSGAAREEAETLYDEALARLHADGVSCAPPRRTIEVGYARSDSEPPNPFDPWAHGRGRNI